MNLTRPKQLGSQLGTMEFETETIKYVTQAYSLDCEGKKNGNKQDLVALRVFSWGQAIVFPKTF